MGVSPLWLYLCLPYGDPWRTTEGQLRPLLAFIGVCRENHIAQIFPAQISRSLWEKNATNGNQKQTVRATKREQYQREKVKCAPKCKVGIGEKLKESVDCRESERWRSCNGNGCISAVVMCMIHWMSVATIAAGSDTLGFTFVRVSEIWVQSFVDAPWPRFFSDRCKVEEIVGWL